MKKILLICLIVIIIIVIVLVIKKERNNNMVSGNLKSFEFFYTAGYAFHADVRYKYTFEDGKHIISYKPYLKAEEESITLEVDEEFVSNIEEIIEKYKVKSWDGFSKSDHNVLDGDSFSLYIHYEEGGVDASGYMKWPNHYGEFKNDIIELFAKYIKEE